MTTPIYNNSDVLQPQAGHRGPNDSAVVFWVDIFLVGILALFTLMQLPRILARLTNTEEARFGHLLYTSQDLSRSRFTSLSSANTMSSHAPLFRRPSAEEEKGVQPIVVPRHIPSWTAVLRPITTILRIPFIGRIHFGGGLLLTGYFVTLLFAGVYKTSLFMNQVRPGYVAVSQIPWVVAFATKNNIISFVSGIGWDHLNYIHRFSGRLLVIAANVHAIGFIYRWTIAGSFTKHISQTRYTWGMVALVSVDVLFFFSLAIWRQRAHNIFFLSHLVAFILFLVAVCLHMPSILSYVLAGAGIYALDVILRAFKTRVTTARIYDVPELCATAVEVPSLNAGWRAGQHVRVRVLSVGMGWYGWAEAHPFTIASASLGTTRQGLVLLCKIAGRWTQKLYQLAADDTRKEDAGVGINIRVMVEGPYGGPGNTMMSSFSGAFMIAGGSGISYALAAAEELLQKAARNTSSVTILDLIWVVRHPEALAPYIPIFSSLMALSVTTTTALQISIFYTRAETHEHNFSALEVPEGITLNPGRPSVALRLQDLLSRTRNATLLPGCGSKPRGVFVGVCGPGPLADDVRRVIDNVESGEQRELGGIELHEEIYAL
ncbi:uncharacterized protein FIBRA_08465 [Fibroporia radiculosa]|uniref:ferric-chelate reductase (NADPH) n=1 Tax=Fibroporia radiculosa TaxID=599839 RepID=J4GWU8_9APHY|nr:uncharacterized protein FIBRA_08465 [Fibroporia radiculosa]CCM06220.1 predicted protein [Fibroporia radiculosa]